MSIGKFVISLDFEMMWGMNDVTKVKHYGKNIRGVHEAIPRLLQVFDKYGVRATFSTVGLLFFATKQQLLQNLPARVPNYTNRQLSPYAGYVDHIGKDYKQDPYHFAPGLIRLIQQYPQQEIGSHTFSHYYCLEDGQMPEDFRADLIQAQKTALQIGIHISSLVFPRNQYNDAYLQVCYESGIRCIRGNEFSWIYEARSANKESWLRRGIRLADTYLNITGHHCYTDAQVKNTVPLNIPASKFLRPFYSPLKLVEKLRLKRIKDAMTHAAKKELMYHLWWHPHNFGVNQEENFAFPEQILNHYHELHAKYGFESHTMSSAANDILNLS